MIISSRHTRLRTIWRIWIAHTHTDTHTRTHTHTQTQTIGLYRHCNRINSQIPQNLRTHINVWYSRHKANKRSWSDAYLLNFGVGISYLSTTMSLCEGGWQTEGERVGRSSLQEYTVYLFVMNMASSGTKLFWGFVQLPSWPQIQLSYFKRRLCVGVCLCVYEPTGLMPVFVYSSVNTTWKFSERNITSKIQEINWIYSSWLFTLSIIMIINWMNIEYSRFVKRNFVEKSGK